jgi:hypothetical protein
MDTWNRDMLAIIRFLSDPAFPRETSNYKPYALVRLAEEGYIRVGVSVSLTAKGRKLAQQLKG